MDNQALMASHVDQSTIAFADPRIWIIGRVIGPRIWITKLSFAKTVLPQLLGPRIWITKLLWLLTTTDLQLVICFFLYPWLPVVCLISVQIWKLGPVDLWTCEVNKLRQFNLKTPFNLRMINLERIIFYVEELFFLKTFGITINQHVIHR